MWSPSLCLDMQNLQALTAILTQTQRYQISKLEIKVLHCILGRSEF